MSFKATIMKIIVSSKNLHDLIQKAIAYEKGTVLISDSKLIFQCGNEVMAMEVVLSYKFVYHHEFNVKQWIPIMLFVHNLPNQPITVEFEPDKISIHCVQQFLI